MILPSFIPPQHHRSQDGFTLLELAIVLVVIGLIVGGVLKGQDLIDEARVQSLIKDLRNIQAAPTVFRATTGTDINLDDTLSDGTDQADAFFLQLDGMVSGLSEGEHESPFGTDYLIFRNAAGVEEDNLEEDGQIDFNPDHVVVVVDVASEAMLREIDATLDDGNYMTGLLLGDDQSPEGGGDFDTNLGSDSCGIDEDEGERCWIMYDLGFSDPAD